MKLSQLSSNSFDFNSVYFTLSPTLSFFDISGALVLAMRNCFRDCVLRKVEVLALDWEQLSFSICGGIEL